MVIIKTYNLSIIFCKTVGPEVGKNNDSGC